MGGGGCWVEEEEKEKEKWLVEEEDIFGGQVEGESKEAQGV